MKLSFGLVFFSPSKFFLRDMSCFLEESSGTREENLCDTRLSLLQSASSFTHHFIFFSCLPLHLFSSSLRKTSHPHLLEMLTKFDTFALLFQERGDKNEEDGSIALRSQE